MTVSVRGAYTKTLTPTSTVDLHTEVQPAPHAFAGLEVAFWHVALGAEFQYAVIPSGQLQLAGTF